MNAVYPACCAETLLNGGGIGPGPGREITFGGRIRAVRFPVTWREG